MYAACKGDDDGEVQDVYDSAGDGTGVTKVESRKCGIITVRFVFTACLRTFSYFTKLRFPKSWEYNIKFYIYLLIFCLIFMGDNYNYYLQLLPFNFSYLNNL